jgi:hypothetical protein
MSINGEKVRFALRRALESINPKFNKTCIVKSVSANPTTGLMTCDCEAIEDKTVLEDVRLVADFKDTANTTGFVLIPKVNSIVIVSFLGDSEYYISMVSDVDNIFINGNNYEGIVKAVELTDKLNALENKVNSIISTFNSHTHPYLNVTTPATTSPSTSPVSGTLTPTQKTDIENNTVKHGNGTLI